MHTLPQEISIDALHNLLWDNSFVGSTIAASEPIQASAVQPCDNSLAEVTPHQHSNLPLNGFHAQDEDQMTGFAMSPLPQTLQTLNLPPNSVSGELSLPSQSLLSQTLLPQSHSAVPPRSARKRRRQDPTPNEEGQYLCAYGDCKKNNPGFRLPCHWQ